MQSAIPEHIVGMMATQAIYRLEDFDTACPVCSATMMKYDKDWIYKCQQCGHWKSDLAPHIVKDTSDRSFDRSAHYAAHAPMRKRVYRMILDRVGKLVPMKAASILDVGCSYGWCLEVARDEYQLIASGLEADPNHVRIGRANGFEILQGFFPQDVPTDRTFDMIIFNDVIEHIPDVAGAVRACHRHLKDGGLLILNIPSAEGAFFFVARTLDRLGYSAPLERMWQLPFPSPHLHFFLPRNLKAMTERMGFEEVHRSWVPTVDGKRLWRRIRVDSSLSLAVSIIVWLGITLMLPILRFLPPDTRLQVFKRR